ncbi:transcription termination factor MTERF8, chloroplastic [Oryza sativa Japonica Group]|jgi:mTERF domain-containing protein|uniref:Os05g0413000 protein n=4 Tax=Oryza TaxID=4527 RepID=Q0DI65_ORYSJ|nr:uncharacterized protein LOC4338789 [Oryza sativa Japonica Group]XP_052154712.1 uncharacterized protein LOC127772781 [Oryza glaberrima]AAT94030.1 unknown protein [Oryza sativa Japonica Group]KAF2930786.1 hypothetical protein DAI22_05g161300 [Oryza sativa Japonica Group]BAF17458.1 Os05g0413000 [Oryza sativa Japonica Group]BAG86643.1 unnamed protein product [Oryza sativa Japonica Group]BAS94013.1 Os05g0413000 [Oryza sativa Japonica Group]|eukprot:NP_001055544.1 Os05g0413000 [Oryza sativa Japonica Group]
MLAAVRRRRLLLLPLPLRFFSAAAAAASTTTDPKVVSYLISSCGLTPAAAARAAATSPWLPLASPDFASNADAVVALLRRYGFTDADISATVRAFSRILASDPARTLQPKLDYLRSVGITAPLLPRVVSLSPVILHRSIESHLAPLIASLREVLGSDSRIVTALRQMPFAMRCSPKATFLRTLPVLRDVHGLTPSELSKLVASQPGVILLGPGRAGEIVQAVKDAGVEPGSPMFVYIFAAFSKLKAPTLENKFAIYRSLGFGKDDIAVMLRRLPNAAGISEERLKRTVGFLTGKAGLRREDIVAYPNLLSRSLDSHARRCAVLAVLRREGKPEGQHRVPHVLVASLARFMKAYVRRYEGEVPDVLRAINGEIPFEGFGLGELEKKKPQRQEKIRR